MEKGRPENLHGFKVRALEGLGDMVTIKSNID